MPYELDKRLVIGVASSALFDLEESDRVFREEGEKNYRLYQEKNIDTTLNPGAAFPFIRRLLALNNLADTPADPLVEVIILSRNDPDTGLRVMRSVKAHDLAISRAIFTRGRSPHTYMSALNMALFLSANEGDIREAVQHGLPAGQVLQVSSADSDASDELRIAFDFDGVLANDAAERVFAENGLERFQEHETELVETPLDPGPLRDLLERVNLIQRREDELDPSGTGERRLRVSIVTARNAPAHERAILSLKSWGVTVDDAFFLGGVEKRHVLEVLQPHVYFDDQLGHLSGVQATIPSVHVPFGISNEQQAV